jgi:hypothetical protein
MCSCLVQQTKPNLSDNCSVAKKGEDVNWGFKEGKALFVIPKGSSKANCGTKEQETIKSRRSAGFRFKLQETKEQCE